MPVTQLIGDSVAVYVVTLLVVVQGLTWWLLWRATHTPLRRQARSIRQTTGVVHKFADAGALARAADVAPEVKQAVRAAYPAGEHEEAADPQAAFDPERLLSPAYNGRLDAAAPGIFTAMGIIGTFVGLIVAFSRLNFADAAGSIQPLIGGMTISFVNSLVGVGLSIIWAWKSRSARHSFDLASRTLVAAFEKRFSRPAYGTNVLEALLGVRAAIEGAGGRIEAELRNLRDTTQGASNNLLESLAPRIEQTFRALVDLPFERLGESVEGFRSIVADAANQSANTIAALDAAAGVLMRAQTGLEEAVGRAQLCVSAFESGVRGLQEGSAAATAIVGESRRAAEVLHGTAHVLASAGERQAQLATSLDETVGELRGTSGALDTAASLFSAGAERMEGAAARIEHLGTEAAELALRAVRDQVQQAVGDMAAALREFGDRSVSAWDSSSARVVEALDARVTDLTDRLSAELQTLAQRLPESASEITRSAGILRQHLRAAVRSLEQSVRSLDTSTSQTLTARLAEYDRLVAQAVDRFSGTILTWDGKLTELGDAGRELRTGITEVRHDVSSSLASARGSSEATTRAAAEALRAAMALQEAATLLSAQHRGQPDEEGSHAPPARPPGLPVPDSARVVT